MLFMRGEVAIKIGLSRDILPLSIQHTVHICPVQNDSLQDISEGATDED